MTSQDSSWERPPPSARRRLAALAAIAALVVAVGSMVRLPSAVQLPVDVDPLPVPAPVTVSFRPLDPIYLTDVRDLSLELGDSAWTVESEDGRLMAVSTRAGVTTIYNPGSFQPVAVLEARVDGERAWFTPDGDALILPVDGALVLHPLDGSPTAEMDVPRGIVQPLRGNRVAIVSTGPSPRLIVANLRARSVAVDQPLDGDVEGLAWDVEGERLYLAGSGRLTAVNLSSGSVVAAAQTPVGAVRQIVASPDGTRLYLAQQEGIHALDSTTLTEVATLEETADALLVSPDGRWLVAGRPDGPLLVDAARLEPVAPLGGPARYPVGFNPSGILYTSGPGPRPDGSTLLAIEPDTRRIVGTRTLLHAGALLPRTAVLTERLTR